MENNPKPKIAVILANLGGPDSLAACFPWPEPLPLLPPFPGEANEKGTWAPRVS